MIFKIVRQIVYIAICRLMYRVKYIGLKNITKDENYVVAANHMSWIDPVAIWAKVPNVRVMAKAEMFKNPIMGWIYRHLGMFPIKRGEKDFSSLYHSINSLKKDKKNLIIFPEGTRNPDNKKIKPKVGAVYLALASGVKIVPVHVTKKPHIFGRITITVGKPYSLNEFKKDIKDKEVLNIKTAELMEKINKLGK